MEGIPAILLVKQQSVSNECLNPIFDSNEDIDNAVGVGNCGGTVSQQDESGSGFGTYNLPDCEPSISSCKGQHQHQHNHH